MYEKTRKNRKHDRNEQKSDGYPPRRRTARLSPMGTRSLDRQYLRQAVGF